MRRVGWMVLLSMLGLGCSETGDKIAAAPLTTFRVAEKEFNFGELQKGDSIDHAFIVENTGSNPLVIRMVKASCGCTTVDWTRQPILPGQSGIIKSRFHAGDPGMARKSVVAEINAAEPYLVFYLTGEVKAEK